MQDNMTSAMRLRAARKAAGLGQGELARQCHYTQSTVANVEQGRARMSLSLAKLAAEVLHVSPAWLLGMDEPEITFEQALAVIIAEGRCGKK